MKTNPVDDHRIAEKADAVIASGSSSEIEALILRLENDQESDEATYCLANLYAALSIKCSENADSWREGSMATYRVKEIDLLRRLLKKKNPFYLEARTNLANALAHQGRGFEALKYWSADFSVSGDVPAVSALAKARQLIFMSHYLPDAGHTDAYRMKAVSLLCLLKNNSSSVSHPDVLKALKEDAQVLGCLEMEEVSKEMNESWRDYPAPTGISTDELKYRRWALNEGLFINPLNDITSSWIADQDILQFPSYTVKTGEGPFLAEAFSAIKREFCYA